MSNPPNPGTLEAQQLGCTCPVIDNHHGKGAYGTGDHFWFTVGCPVHHPVDPDATMTSKPLHHGEEHDA